MKKTDLIDVAISFDTTGSMYPCLAEVRNKLNSMVTRLFNDIPNLRIALIAHGDYCDEGVTYVTKKLDFTSNIEVLRNFIQNVERTYGGDAPECYELAMQVARTRLLWGAGRQKVLLMIGDDVPHPVHYPGNVLNIDWRNELGLMVEAGIKVYGCHAMPGIRSHSKAFYSEIAAITGGHYLTLDQFSVISDMIMGICYEQQSQVSLDKFITEVVGSGRMTRGLSSSFKAMGGETPAMFQPVMRGGGTLNPVPSGRFQMFTPHIDVPIKDFIETQGIEFKKGRGFYQLSKSVKVQQYKEIILVNKTGGDIYNGPQVRQMLGLLPQTESGGTTQRLNQSHLMGEYDIFIQSTSYNRKLLSDFKFLYEVDDWDRTDLVAMTPIRRKPLSRSKIAKAVKSVSAKRTSRSSPVTPARVTSTRKAPKARRGPKSTKGVTMSEVPKRLEAAKTAYEVKERNPDMTWDEVTIRTDYTSASGARKGAKRYEDFISG